MADATISVLDNGPLIVKGDIDLLDGEGKAYAGRLLPRHICRCGASQNRPFCDGAHAQASFESAERASE